MLNEEKEKEKFNHFHSPVKTTIIKLDSDDLHLTATLKINRYPRSSMHLLSIRK